MQIRDIERMPISAPLVAQSIRCRSQNSPQTILTSEGTAVILSILIKCPTMAGFTGALESAMTAS
jgi:hypothetical protein